MLPVEHRYNLQPNVKVFNQPWALKFATKSYREYNKICKYDSDKLGRAGQII